MNSEQDYLSRIEAEMLQDGLLQKKVRHPQHIKCTCPRCKPWEGYVVKWLTSKESKIRLESAEIDAVIPRIFTVRLKGEACVSFDSKGRQTNWRGMPLGHFVALPAAMPVISSELISIE